MINLIYISAGLLIIAQVSALSKVWNDVIKIESRKGKEWNE